jgi:hypothetical protein
MSSRGSLAARKSKVIDALDRVSLVVRVRAMLFAGAMWELLMSEPFAKQRALCDKRSAHCSPPPTR